MSGPQLYTDCQLTVYGPKQVREFARSLEEQDRYTVMAPLDHPEQLLLTPDCRTQKGNFRYSRAAFYRLCRIVCPGLSDVAADVAGLRRRRKDDADRMRFSVSDAVLILNTIVRRRFRTDLEGMQTVRDARTGVIEGIVGRQYRRLSNLEMYNRIDEVLKSYKRPVEFYGASLYARCMILHYRDRDPLFVVEAPPNFNDVYYGGFYYSNSEIGDGSVRATTTVVRAFTDTKALGFFGRAGRLSHAGKDFKRRFERLLDNVVQRRPDVEQLKAGVIRMMDRPLGFGSTDDAAEERFLELERFLRANQMTKCLARRILRGVILQSSFDLSPVADVKYVQRHMWASRTEYDLFNSMIRVSRDLPITLQESVEQLAYSMLLGRVHLPKRESADD